MAGLWREIDKMKSSAETKTRKVLKKIESSSAAHFLLVELPFFTLARVPGLPARHSLVHFEVGRESLFFADPSLHKGGSHTAGSPGGLSTCSIRIASPGSWLYGQVSGPTQKY